MGKDEKAPNQNNCKDALPTSNSKISDLKGFRKDHKRCTDLTIGPPLRPVVGASESSNAPLSWLMGKIIDVVTQQIDDKNRHICDSTEDLVARVTETNKELRKPESKEKEF